MLRKAKADYGPKINMAAGIQSGSIGFLNMHMDVTTTWYAAPNLQWEIDFWGKYRRATEAARADLMGSEYARRQLALSLIGEVASAYFNLLDFDARLAIARQTVQTRRASMDIIQSRFDEGTVAEIDVNQAQIQEAIAAANVPLYERSIALTENVLNVLLGRNPQAVERGQSLVDQVIPPDIPTGIPSELLRRRPDLLQAEQAVVAQNARIGMAVAMRYPSISLTAALGLASNDLNSFVIGDAFVWSVAGSLVAPLVHWGANKRRVEAERIRTEQAILAYEQRILTAFAEVENALVEVATYRRESVARTRQAAAATNAAELSQARYDGGVTSYLEVLESDRSRFEAALQASQTRAFYLNAYVKLYKALGGGWIVPEEAQASTPSDGQ
jgi:multidrug efflux system outer membrane protein